MGEAGVGGLGQVGRLVAAAEHDLPSHRQLVFDGGLLQVANGSTTNGSIELKEFAARDTLFRSYVPDIHYVSCVISI